MSEPLFPSFRESEEAFAECSTYWHRLMLDAASSFQPGDWRAGQKGDEQNIPRPLLPLDMRIVYEAYAKALGRIVQVYQWPPEPEPADNDIITPVLKELEAEDDGDAPYLFLDLNMTLTEDTARIASDLLSAFANPGNGKEELERIIRSGTRREGPPE